MFDCWSRQNEAALLQMRSCLFSLSVSPKICSGEIHETVQSGPSDKLRQFCHKLNPVCFFIFPETKNQTVCDRSVFSFTLQIFVESLLYGETRIGSGEQDRNGVCCHVWWGVMINNYTNKCVTILWEELGGKHRMLRQGDSEKDSLRHHHAVLALRQTERKTHHH